MTDIRAVILLPERRSSSRAKRPWRTLRRGVWVTAGFALMALGAIGAVLPGHLGLPVLVAGLALVLRNSMQAKRAFVRLQRRKPNWVYPIRRLMRPNPEFLPVIWQTMLRTERLLFTWARNLRVLKRARRTVRGWFRR